MALAVLTPRVADALMGGDDAGRDGHGRGPRGGIDHGEITTVIRPLRPWWQRMFMGPYAHRWVGGRDRVRLREMWDGVP